MDSSNRPLALSIFGGAIMCLAAACGDDEPTPTPDSSAVCASDSDCDDGAFCNGVERCRPDDGGANALGCVAAMNPPCESGMCNEGLEQCSGGCIDADGDGAEDQACGGDDCDDSDPDRYPSNTEVCDLENVDEDCDPTTFGTRDLDEDGHVDARCCNGSTCGTDCDETSSGTHPNVPEVCDRRDNDCDGMIDEGLLQSVYPDEDRDLHGDMDAAPILACPGVAGTSASMLDCDDADTSINGPQPELLDGKDNDCDERVDEEPADAVWYPDEDGDGFGASGTTVISNRPVDGHSLLSTDCDDSDEAVSPRAQELCNALDDNCDGERDYMIGVNDWEDDDHDGFPDISCAEDSARADCDDTDPSTFPSAAERCDSRDNDCDGAIDEECESSSGDAGMSDGGSQDAGLGDASNSRCEEDERVEAHECTPCPEGSTNAAGDDPAGDDTMCDDPCFILGVTCSELEQTYLKASNSDRLDSFGYSVALDGNTLAVGATGERSEAVGVDGDETDNGQSFSGAVYVFEKTDGLWSQAAYLKASHTTNGRFGWSLALDGDTLAVGARAEGSNSTGINPAPTSFTAPGSGAVFVFVRSGGSWLQQAYIKASNTDRNDGFGTAIALDGDTLVVGAPGEGSGVPGDEMDDSAYAAGAVYVFERELGEWAQQAYLKASNPDMGDELGYSVALNGDTLVIGAPGESSGSGEPPTDNSALRAGAVYVLTRSGDSWVPHSLLKASDTTSNAQFGFRVDLEGNFLAASTPARGIVYIFQYVDPNWSEDFMITAPNGDDGDRFGSSISLSGNYLAIGAPNEASASSGIGGDPSDNSSVDVGAAYIFFFDGAQWADHAYIKASNAFADDQFGGAIAIDGTTLVVGARFEDSDADGVNGDQDDDTAMSSGAVYVMP